MMSHSDNSPLSGDARKTVCLCIFSQNLLRATCVHLASIESFFQGRRITKRGDKRQLKLLLQQPLLRLHLSCLMSDNYQLGHPAPKAFCPPVCRAQTLAGNMHKPNSQTPRTLVSLSIIKSLPRFHQRQHHRCDPTLLAVSRPSPSSLSLSPSLTLSHSLPHTHTHTDSQPPPTLQSISGEPFIFKAPQSLGL